MAKTFPSTCVFLALLIVGASGQAADLEPIDNGIACLQESMTVWGDYDNDGDLDLFRTGTDSDWIAHSFLYRNDPPVGGERVFTDVSGAQFDPFTVGTEKHRAEWGDYDNDGDLDLLVGDMSEETVIYRNDGSDTFVKIATPLTSRGASPYWVDYDNDGDLDIQAEYNIARNDGADVFTLDSNAEIRTPSSSTRGDWGDYDGDGDLDLVWKNHSAGGGITLYRNDAGVFTEAGSVLETTDRRGSVDWGDYDGDGDLDLVFCTNGYDGQDAFFISRIFTNDGGLFSDSGIYDLPDSYSCQVEWGDYDNDGLYDVLMSGHVGPDPEWSAQVCLNTGAGAFTLGDSIADEPSHDGFQDSWGDYDGDGDLDLARSALSSPAPLDCATVYRNNTDVPNTPPTAPTGLVVTTYAYGTETATFEWDQATDNESAPGLLTYNLQAGTSPGAIDLRAGEADSLTGERRIPRQGTVGDWRLTQLRVPAGTTAYWRVQAIDPAFAGGPWSVEYDVNSNDYVAVTTHEPTQVTDHSAIISATAADGGSVVTTKGLLWHTEPTPTVDNYLGSLDFGSGPGLMTHSLTALDAHQTYYARGWADDGSVLVYGGVQSFTPAYFDEVAGTAFAGVWGHAIFGDYDSDGDQDVVVCGADSTRVWRNDGGAFTAVADLAVAPHGMMAWGDYDNDTDLDLLLTRGEDGPVDAYVYRNDGLDTFTDIGLADVPSSGGLGEAAWVDYDNDGDLDATAVGGRDGFLEYASVIFRNDGADSFTIVDPGLPEPMHAGQGWADYDLDGDMDWAVCGQGSGGEITRIYNNDGGVFTDIAAGLEVGNACDLAWGDYDNDGDPDLLLQGPSGAATNAILYRNDVPTGGGFSEVQINVPKNLWGRAAWGDCDNDGDLDLLVTGWDTTAVYLNQGGDTFIEVPANLPHVYNSTVAWGDVDGDDDLDILLTGDTGSELITRIYSNTMDVGLNTAPLAPTGLSAETVGDTVTLTWSAASDGETPSAGLGYNLRIGTTSSAEDIVTGMADLSTGLRRVPMHGNAGQSLSWNISGLPLGASYYWSVQAVDAALAGGPWADEVFSGLFADGFESGDRSAWSTTFP